MLKKLTTLDQWLDYQQNLHNKTIDLGLERITKVYKKLFKKKINFKVIAIAGTNGKGSTGAFIAHILQAANISYGWFSSPHILHYNERFNINGVYATDLQIINSFKIIEQARTNISLSYFEFSTLAALIIFSQQKIKIAILEVGLGARLDSVNMIDNDISIITSIALDHCEYLGNNLTKIATEKAAIMRSNQICICPYGLPNIIDKIANKINNNLIKVKPYNGKVGLLGEWQKSNAALALNAVKLLNLAIDDKTITKALEDTKLIARAQLIKYQGKNFLFDIAHNPQAVSKLATIIPTPSIAIFAALKDKDIAAMVKIIDSKIDKWFLLPLAKNQRTIDVKILAQYFNQHKIIMNSSIEETMDKILTSNYKNIVVFGSFLTINCVLNYFKLINKKIIQK